MATLLEDLDALLALQQIDTRIDRHKAGIAALDTGADVRAAHGKQAAEAAALRSVANKAQAAQKDAELKLTAVEDKAKQVNLALYSGKTTGSRELTNLQNELEMLGRQKGTVEDEVLEAMEIASDAVAAADAADARLAALAAEYRKVRTHFQVRTAELQAQIEALAPERDRALQAVGSVALLNKYDHIRTRAGHGVGAAPLPLEGSACGACHTRINSTLVETALAGASVAVCEHCQRILVPVRK